MSLIIETGSGVTGANSYVTVLELRAFGTLRGLTLGSDAALEIALVLACDKLESSYKYKGRKTVETQPLLWPRQLVYLEDAYNPLSSTSIPDKLKQAQCQFAYEATLRDLQPTGTGQEVLKKKVDVIEIEYAKSGSGTITPEFNKAEEMLRPLLLDAGFGLTTVRI